MPFVKLDQGILDSTLWVERECREIFITALLLAEPIELLEPMPQLEVREIKETGFIVPPGWYGMARAAGVGIARRAMVEPDVALVALERLGSPDPESRSADFDGRRMVRVDGGFIVLNFMKYRDRDYTAADRARRYRERKKDKLSSHRDVTSSHRNITQAEAEAEAEAEAVKTRSRSSPSANRPRKCSIPKDFRISERVAKWAESKQIENLEAHFENFVSACMAKGYAYVDWDEALMRAVRDDWAQIGDGRKRVAV